MVDTPLITRDSVARARDALLAQGRKASQRAVIKHLGGGSFSQVGPLLRELESEAGEVPGSALTEPLTAAVTEAVRGYRTIGSVVVEGDSSMFGGSGVQVCEYVDFASEVSGEGFETCLQL